MTKIYSVYDKDGNCMCAYVTAKEASKAMGIKYDSFKRTVYRQKIKGLKKYMIQEEKIE